MIKVGIIGVTGYAGATLAGLCARHSDIKLEYLASHSYAGKKFSDVYPQFKNVVDDILQEDNIEKASLTCDCIFLCLPSGIASKAVTKEVLSRSVVIDLGADYRLNDEEVYKQWYKLEHQSPELLKDAVYGLCEVNRNLIKTSRLIANPGCYTTCSILTLYPLVKHKLIDLDSIVIDAKSGISGAGRSEKLASLYCECSDSIKPYGVKTHRHTPEIEQELSKAAGESVMLQFTPHLTPMSRGILASVYAKAKVGVTQADIDAAYKAEYQNEKFIRLINSVPETRFVKGSNFVDVFATLDERTGRVLAFGALDNVVKGAAGQALQNLNIIFGLEESKGLETAIAVC